ncbi:MAG: protein arginine kinase [Sedimentisphaerales bacterium]|nr:protein arginine kinase [Sedimentisphaerales bacterium]
MRLNELSSKISQWFDPESPLSDIVISSRIRLARNLAGHKFISRCSNEQKEEILKILKETILSLKELSNIFFFDIPQHSCLERDLLVERQLISRNLATGHGPRGAVIAKNELFAAQINEEDHLRLSVLAGGLNLEKCWQRINDIDDAIGKKVSYAFSPKLGFLTACPTNLGTGIRVSVMLHLPGLKMTDQLKKLFNSAKDMNLTVRGLFGEGTEAVGDFFQLSNQVTLGINEKQIVEDFETVIIPKIVEYERLARDELVVKDPNILDDRVSRALAVLKSAKLISSHEALFLLSNLRMGINMGRIKEISINTINELFMLTQPAHLQINKGENLDAEQRDVLRAETLRAKLN